MYPPRPRDRQLNETKENMRLCYIRRKQANIIVAAVVLIDSLYGAFNHSIQLFHRNIVEWIAP